MRNITERTSSAHHAVLRTHVLTSFETGEGAAPSGRRRRHLDVDDVQLDVDGRRVVVASLGLHLTLHGVELRLRCRL